MDNDFAIAVIVALTNYASKLWWARKVFLKIQKLC